MSKDVEIEVEVRAETAGALLVYDGRTQVWIPRSQIKDQCEDGEGTITSIFISPWLAEIKGLV